MRELIIINSSLILATKEIEINEVGFEWQARNVLDKDKSSLQNNEAYREKWRKLEEFPQKSFHSK